MYTTKCIFNIMAIGVLPIYAVNQRFALGIGFKAEGHVPMSVCPHLIAVKGLNVTDLIFHFLNDLGAIRPVIGQEVDHPHGARFAHVQIQRMLARGVEAIACSHVFPFEGQAEMHIVLCGWRRRLPDRREAKQRENARGQFDWNGETIHDWPLCLYVA